MGTTIRDFLDAQRRIQMTFMERPELKLTRAQMRRVLGLSVEGCETAVAALIQSGFLTESLDGLLMRGTNRDHSPGAYPTHGFDSPTPRPPS